MRVRASPEKGGKRRRMLKICRKIIRNASIWIPVTALIISGIYLGYRYWDYRTAESGYEEIADKYVQRNGHAAKAAEPSPTGIPNPGTDSDGTEPALPALEEGEESDEDLPDVPSVDWKSMKKEGKDIVAWLEIPSLEIRYPVVQGSDNDEYLHHMPSGEYKYAGSIFMDCQNSDSFSDINTIIYGHNMDSGAMFGKFRNYGQEEYDSDPMIWICTPDKAMLYKIVSYHTAHVGDETYTLFSGYQPSERADAWIRKEAAKSSIASPLPNEYIQRLVTLSTCATRSDERRVLQAVLVREIRPVTR